MKKIGKRILAILILLIVTVGLFATGAITKEVTVTTFFDGIYIEDVAMGGKTLDQANKEVSAYIDTLLSKSITLQIDEEREVVTTIKNLGVTCSNIEVIEEAYGYARNGNLLENYSEKQKLKEMPQSYTLEFSVDEEVLRAFMKTQFETYNREPIDGVYARVDGELDITPDVKGLRFNLEKSLLNFVAYVDENIDEEDLSFPIVFEIAEAELTEELLLSMNDLLGTYTTGYSTSGWSRSRNLENGIRKIDGWILNPGDAFSLYEATHPFVYENGYYDAGAYLGGIVVESIGGGMCQVTTTLYNAALLAELEITQRDAHSMTVSYVPLSMDAALSGTTKDLKFVNNQEYPIYIEGIYENQEITVNIYGMDTRADNREISFYTEITEKIVPTNTLIVQTEEYNFGYVKTQGVHYGYETILWKIIYEDGEEVERVQVNESSYNAVPRTLVVGVAGASDEIRVAVGAAASTGDIDHTRGTVSGILNPVEE